MECPSGRRSDGDRETARRRARRERRGACGGDEARVGRRSRHTTTVACSHTSDATPTVVARFGHHDVSKPRQSPRELLRGEDGTDDHGRATPRTATTSRAVDGASRAAASASEQTPGEGESRGATVIGEIAKLPNAHEAARQHVLHEAPEKLHRGERHRATLTLMGIVLPAKRDALAIKRDQAVIADRDAMGIPTEVPQHGGRAAEGRLRIDDPVGAKQRVDKRVPAGRLAEGALSRR